MQKISVSLQCRATSSEITPPSARRPSRAPRVDLSGVSMLKKFEKLKTVFDGAVEKRARRDAGTHGRRSFLSKVGTALVGTALVPMLPFDRFNEAQAGSMKSRQDTDQ